MKELIGNNRDCNLLSTLTWPTCQYKCGFQPNSQTLAVDQLIYLFTRMGNLTPSHHFSLILYSDLNIACTIHHKLTVNIQLSCSTEKVAKCICKQKIREFETRCSFDGNFANFRYNIGIWLTVWVKQVAIRVSKLPWLLRHFQISFEEQFANRNSYCGLWWLTYIIIIPWHLREGRK